MLKATLWPQCNSTLELVLFFGRVSLLRKGERVPGWKWLLLVQGDVWGQQCHLLFAQ